jgi:phosphopantetheinyl transferase
MKQSLPLKACARAVDELRARAGENPPADPIELWIAQLDALALPLSELETCEPLCPAGELDGFDVHRRVARQLLRRLIARVFGRTFAKLPFTTGPHGKPHLPGLPGDFNLSHTMAEGAGAFALVAAGRAAAIGVDIEPRRAVRIDARRRASIIEAGIHAAGGADLPAHEDERVLQAWVRLEAWGKATGCGIGRTLSHFGVWGRASSALGARDAESDALIVFDVDAGPGLRGAIALPRGTRSPPLRAVPLNPAEVRQLLA